MHHSAGHRPFLDGSIPASAPPRHELGTTSIPGPASAVAPRMTGPMPRVESRANGQNEAKGLRLAMVTARFPPLLGGIETHVDEVARRMAGRGVDVTVLTTDVSRRLLPANTEKGSAFRRFRAGPRGTDLHASLGLVENLPVEGTTSCTCRDSTRSCPP